MDERTNYNVTVRREAGAVRRWHLIPHHGVDTVGHHSWNATMLLLELNPGASKALIVYMLEHDVTERWTGDISASAKGMYPMIAAGVKKAEIELIDEMGLMNPEGLTEDERRWARAIDALESILWCDEQRAMGNRNVKHALASLERWFRDEDWIPEPIQTFYINYKWQRTPDYITEGKHYGNNE